MFVLDQLKIHRSYSALSERAFQRILSSAQAGTVAINDFITWYCLNPDWRFGGTVVLRYRYELEAGRLALPEAN
jgi:hypothetical protein